MAERVGWLRHNAARLVAVAAIALIGLGVRMPRLSDAELAELAAPFSFTAVRLAEWQGGLYKSRRSVNPSLERHSGWISAVGAAVALADLDADGVANDVCHVDPRTDLVTLAPVPETGDRYPIMSLEPRGLHYDARVMAPMGCIPSDLDEDGRMDLFVYYWGRTPVIFLNRAGPGMAPGPGTYLAQELTSSGERWYTNAATFTDLDGDGHLDLVIGNYFQDGAHILDAEATNVDSMQHSMSRAYNGGRNRLFLWSAAEPGLHPRVTFEEIEGIFDRDALHAWTLAIGAADLDGDLLPELYFANDFGPDRFYHNASLPGRLRFTLMEGSRKLGTPRSRVLGRDSFKGMGIDFADVNGDEKLDFFVSNISAEYALFESHFLFVSEGDLGRMSEGVAPYRDAGDALGVARSSWGWDTRFGDFDNDGYPEALQATGFARGDVDRWPELQELATANDELLKLPGAWPHLQVGDDLSGHAPNPFYVRAADGRFYDISAELGIDAPHVTRGIASADVDADGDLDFVVANQWEPSFLYRNDRNDPRSPPDSTTRDFLGLRLVLPAGAESAGAQATRPAVGAAVRLRRADGRVLIGQVDGGNGHSGVRSPELHFGLGDTATNEPVQVEIRYRDRSGTPALLTLDLRPGWHTVVLPDAGGTDRLAALRPTDRRSADRADMAGATR
jgi:hypothetical protein